MPASLVYFSKFRNLGDFWPNLACHSWINNTDRGSLDISLEPARRAEENAVYRMSLALSKPEISGFQFAFSG